MTRSRISSILTSLSKSKRWVVKLLLNFMMHPAFQITQRYTLNYTFIFFHILLFFFIHNIAAINTASELLTETLADGADRDPCKKVECGQGTCAASNVTLLGFECLCKPGWSKMQLGPIVFPACTIPNCTINSQCGNGAPPPPPPPPVNPPPFNLLNPCNIVWCGDGTCIANGMGYSCKCNEGSANVLNLTGVACLKECFLGVDCKGVSLGPPLTPPPPPLPGTAFGRPPTSSPPPPPQPNNASSNVPNRSTSLVPVTLMILLLCQIFFLACF